MAQLNYKLPAGVMTAYGDALKGTVDTRLAKANAIGNTTGLVSKTFVDGEMARRERKALEQAEIEKIEKKRQGALNGMQEKFYTQAQKVSNGTAALGTEGQDIFKQDFIDPLARLHDEAVLDGNNQEARKLRGIVTTVGLNTKDLAASLKTTAENAGSSALDKDSIPEEDWEWMQWVIDVKNSSLYLKSDLGDGSDNTGDVYYEIPAAEGEEPVRVTRDMLIKLNTVYMKPDPAPFAKSLDVIAAKSKKAHEAGEDYVIPNTHMQQVRESITPDSIRGMMFNKDVWSAMDVDNDGKAQSWFDQWSVQDIKVDISLGEGASDKLMEIAGDDNIIQPEELKTVNSEGGVENVPLTLADKKVLASMLALPENIEEGRAILSAYAKKRLENQVYVAPEETETANNSNGTNIQYA